MIFAQIKDGKVVNTIILNDSDLIETFASGFDHFIRIDELTPVPGIGWDFDGIQFLQPQESQDGDD